MPNHDASDILDDLSAIAADPAAVPPDRIAAAAEEAARLIAFLRGLVTLPYPANAAPSAMRPTVRGLDAPDP